VTYSDRSVLFDVQLINSTEALIAYPDAIEYSVQDGTISDLTLTSSLDVLHNTVFVTTSTLNLTVSPFVVGYDLNQT
jgi:hypothetical protein